jgi:uncharacterized damage-inducible protein DinB
MTTQTHELLDKESARIWAAIDGKSEADLHQPIRDDGWTAFQILSHLLTGTSGLTYIAKLATEDGAAGAQRGMDSPGFDLNRWNEEQVAAWQGRSLNDLRAEWEAMIARTHRLLDSLTEADLARTAATPFGPATPLSDLLSGITFHMRVHRQELERGLAGELVAPIEH